jgi:hypothetical protein
MTAIKSSARKKRLQSYPSGFENPERYRLEGEFLQRCIVPGVLILS